MQRNGKAQTVRNTYNETELVETVDDVEQLSLATLVEVRSLKQCRRWDSVRLGSIVEVLNVTHRDEAARRFRVERRRRQPGSFRQLVDQSETQLESITLRVSTKITRSNSYKLVTHSQCHCHTIFACSIGLPSVIQMKRTLSSHIRGV